MDRHRFSSIGHTDHVYCSPLDPSRVEQVLGLLDLSPSARVVDFGCGKAELLIRLVERFGVKAVGVEVSPYFVAEARRRSTGRIPYEMLELREQDAAELTVPPGSLDLAIAIGAAQIFGGYCRAVGALAAMVRRGGYVLLGDPYWKRPPDPSYLAALGASPDDHQDHAENYYTGSEHGLTPVYSMASSEAEWDHYEGLYWRAVERYAAAHPDDPEVAAIRERGERVRDSYMQGGRETLGFGVYLYVKRPSRAPR